MRVTPWDHLEPYRIVGTRGTTDGAFQVPHHTTKAELRILSSSGRGWEHVSVSLRNRTPNWREMEFVCRLFWNNDEAVMQLHPPREFWISNHETCLHMWKPLGEAIPMPPSWMVGIKHEGLLSPERAYALAQMLGDVPEEDMPTAILRLEQGETP